MSEETEVEALQSTLAGVHAALWGYGLVASRLRDTADEAAADTGYTDYQRLRNRLDAMIRRRDAAPTAAEAGYDLPFDVTDEASARRLAVHIEEGCAPLLGHLVTATENPDLVNFAATQLAALTQRRVRLGAEPDAFPGLLSEPS